METKNNVPLLEKENVDNITEASTIKTTTPERISLTTPQKVAETKTTITSISTGSTGTTESTRTSNLVTETVTTEVNRNATSTPIEIPLTTMRTTTLIPLNELIKTFYAQTVLNNTTEPPKNYTRISITTVKPMLNKTLTTTIRPTETTTKKQDVELINRFSAPLLNSKPQIVNTETKPSTTSKPTAPSSTIDMTMDAEMMSEINQFIANALETINVENLQTEKYNVENVLDNSLNDKNIMKETTTATSNLSDNKSTQQLTTEWKQIYSTSSEKYKDNTMQKTTHSNPTTETLLKENYEIAINESNSTTNRPEYNITKGITQFKSTTETSPASFTTTKHTTKFTVTKPDIQTSNFTNNMVTTMANISTKKSSNTTQKPTTSSINSTSTTIKPTQTTNKPIKTTIQYVQSTENKVILQKYHFNKS